MELLAEIILALALIAALNVLGPRMGVAPQIILVAVGAGISYLPHTEVLALKPEFVMMGLLPVLLYASSLALPTIEFRRDLAAIGGLSIVLVIITAIILGWTIHWLIPDIPLPIGVALGALLSPTDAAAMGVVKRLGLSPRLLAILDGEALLNDASALILVRTGLAAVATGFTFWNATGSFLFAAVVAAVIGIVVGQVDLIIRQRIASPALATAISFLVPFVSFLLADLAGASGLVAAVAAGIMTRQQAPKRLSAAQRMTENANWRTIAFLAEGMVFLSMGVQIKGLIADLVASEETVAAVLLLSAITWVIAMATRGGFVAGVIGFTHRSTARKHALRQTWQARTDHERRLRPHSPKRPSLVTMAASRLRRRPHPQAEHHRFERLRDFMHRYSADVDYLIHERLGAREGILLTWGGMRGVVTVAAAQSLPLDLMHRPLVLLIAFTVATGSLLLQGVPLPLLASGLKLVGRAGTSREAVIKLRTELDQVALDVLNDPELVRADGSPFDPALIEETKHRTTAVTPNEEASVDWPQVCELRQKILDARRHALQDAQSLGTYASSTVLHVLSRLDAEEIRLRLEDPDD